MSQYFDNYLNWLQILESNYATSDDTIIHLPAAGSELTNKPISYKFGGNQQTTPLNWDVSASVACTDYQLQSYTGPAFTLDVDMGYRRRTTNCLVRVKPLVSTDAKYVELDDSWLCTIECNETTTFSSTLTNVIAPDDIFFAFRPSLEFFYINLPRNRNYQYYRIKLWKSGLTTTKRILITDLFLGDNVDLDRAPARGLGTQTVDPSSVFVAESGRKYFLRKTAYQTISGIELPLLKRWQMSSLKIWSDRVGIVDPFWIILDPRGVWDGPSFGATFGIYRLASMPVFQHQFLDYWGTSLDLEEAI